MSKVFFIILGVVVVVALYNTWKIVRAFSIARPLVQTAVAFNLEDPSLEKTVLVVGDSTAVGVGGKGELSVPGRLSQWLNASIENYGKSGARTRDITEQLSRAKLARYDLLLIQIGANDVIYFSSIGRTQQELLEVLHLAKKKSDKVLLLTAGDIGDAPVFSFPINEIFSARTRALRKHFSETAARLGIVYVDIYAKPSPFGSDPTRYYAPDGLHLSGDGYGYWFSIVQKYVQENWPNIVR
ncbi:MAG: hypothetical protein RIQ56_825 [Candidatus Parcubacteria bacterium]|jgi:lysophospholipase L1-like esterase